MAPDVSARSSGRRGDVVSLPDELSKRAGRAEMNMSSLDVDVMAMDRVRAATTDTTSFDEAWTRTGYVPKDAADSRAYSAWKARQHMGAAIDTLVSLMTNSNRDSVKRAAAADILHLANETASDREEGSLEKPVPAVYVVTDTEGLRSELERRKRK